MPKLVWRVKLVAELEPGVATETEVARIERGEAIGLADLGLRLEEVKESMQSRGGSFPGRVRGQFAERGGPPLRAVGRPK